MNEQRCLEYCIEYGGNFPDDLRTALHVREWVGQRALAWAFNDEERAAATAAIEWAKNYLSDRQTTEAKAASQCPSPRQLSLDLCG